MRDFNKFYEELVELYKTDEDAFNTRKKEIIEQEIIDRGLPAEQAERYRNAIWRMDKELEKHKDPLNRFNALVEMFYETLNKFNDTVKNPHVPKTSADVIPFKKNK